VRRVAEAGALFLTLVAVSLLVFAGPTAYFSFHPLAYTVFPFVIWAALRFGQPAVALVTFVASGVAIWGTVSGHGPFAARTTNESLILLQIYMGAVAVTALVLGAVTIEREQAKESARQSRDELRLTLRRLAAVHAVTSALARSASLEEAAVPILQTVGKTLRCDLGVLWEVDAEADVLRCAGVWHLHTESSAFEPFSRQIALAPGEGLPGRAWSTGEPAWVLDAASSRSVANNGNGPHGALAIPLRTDGNVLGVLEFFGSNLHQFDGELFPLLTGLGSQIAQFIERRHAESVVHARAGEFSLARVIQQGLLPKAPPILPGLEIATASHPAQETGGDYFDFIPMPDSHWGIVIGDASGHGIGAALLVAETRAYLRALALTNPDPGQVLDKVNQRLFEDIGTDHFVTLFLGRLHPITHSLVYSNAGHLSAYVLDGQGAVKRVLPSTGFPLGAVLDAAFPNSPEVRLESGDLLLLLSDGIVEAPATEGPLFGMGRTLEVVQAHRHESPRKIIAALLHQVRKWSGSAQVDDMTAIVIKVRG
jgi:serine phosphatase RsbU (regulator of sigma subunit)